MGLGEESFYIITYFKLIVNQNEIAELLNFELIITYFKLIVNQNEQRATP